MPHSFVLFGLSYFFVMLFPNDVCLWYQSGSQSLAEAERIPLRMLLFSKTDTAFLFCVAFRRDKLVCFFFMLHLPPATLEACNIPCFLLSTTATTATLAAAWYSNSETEGSTILQCKTVGGLGGFTVVRKAKTSSIAKETQKSNRKAAPNPTDYRPEVVAVLQRAQSISAIFKLFLTMLINHVGKCFNESICFVLLLDNRTRNVRVKNGNSRM